MTAPFDHGSEYHDLPLHSAAEGPHPWDGHDPRYYSSGRDALRALMLHLLPLGRKRLWLPTYFCQAVARNLECRGLPLAHYRCGPHTPPAAPTSCPYGCHDAVLVVNYFGMTPAAPEPDIAALGACVIEDHTHDPWSTWAFESRADYCLVSLRKTLPVADGAVLWSPTGQRLPRGGSRHDLLGPLSRRAAMSLKALYLMGAEASKTEARRLFALGEELIGESTDCAISPWALSALDTFPWRHWRDARRSNYQVAARRIANDGPPWMAAMEVPTGDCCPYCVPLTVTSRRRRDALQAALIQRSVYTSVLWDLDNAVWTGDESLDPDGRQRCFAGRLLCLYCDGRYSVTDMDMAVDRLLDAASECGT